MYNPDAGHAVYIRPDGVSHLLGSPPEWINLMKEDFALSLMPLAPSNDLIPRVSHEMNYLFPLIITRASTSKCLK